VETDLKKNVISFDELGLDQV